MWQINEFINYFCYMLYELFAKNENAILAFLGPQIEWELNQHGCEICGAASAMKLGSFT